MHPVSKNHFGIVNIMDIANRIPDSAHESGDIQPSRLLKTENVKTVHYSDSQQLIIWLPENGRLYDSIKIYDTANNSMIWNRKVEDILNGSIQLIIDTLPLPAGMFAVTISRSDGVKHLITIKKHSEQELPASPEKVTKKIPPSESSPIVYKDGFGNTIPGEDLLLRKNLSDKLSKQFSRKVLFEGNVRAGTVKYIEGDRTARFYSEMGGGNCLFYIDIPTTENWEKQTGFPLSERDAILQFIAEETLRNQTSSSNTCFVIGERDITFMKA